MATSFTQVVCVVAVCWTTCSATYWTSALSAKDPFARAPASLLEHVDKTIAQQPKFVAEPRYALLVLGAKAEALVWMVEDGKTLYLDQNANGDLTDDGPPLTQTSLEKWNNGNKACYQCEYVLEKFTPTGRDPQTEFKLRRWNYGEANDSYGLSLTLNSQTPMYAGWFGTFWAKSAADVPLVHFGGPMSPRLLRFKELAIGATDQRLSIALVNPGTGEGATSRLSIDALPREIVPVVEIDWPVADGKQAVRTSHQLTERCCYWEFYNKLFHAPAGVISGTARATISLPEYAFPFELASSTLEFPVVAQGSTKKTPDD